MAVQYLSQPLTIAALKPFNHARAFRRGIKRRMLLANAILTSMLTPEEHTAFEQSTARVAAAALPALRNAVASDAGQTNPLSSTTHTVRFITHLHRGLDQVAAQAAATGPAMHCQAGCAHCCRVRVEATEPEIFWIAQHLRQSAPHDVQRIMTVLADRIQERLEESRTMPASGPALTCAFLVDAKCSIYPVRPAVCRKAHSLDVQACASHAPTIAQNLALLLQSESLIQGSNIAYREAGLSMQPQELLAGVLQALTNPQWEQDWSGSAASIPTHSTDENTSGDV